MRFCSLGSGSSGNATLVEAFSGTQTTRVLIDCGLAHKQLSERLIDRQLSFADIDAVFVTHEHSDHVGCARQIAVQERIPVWMSRGTYAAMGSPDMAGKVFFARDAQYLSIKGLVLYPLTVAHDAKEPLQLVLTDGAVRLGILTDIGMLTPYVIEQMQNLDAVILEFNHDEALLKNSKYPLFLKQRIAGDYGHLSNQQSVKLLESICHPGLRYVVAAHLSEQNNAPHLVLELLQEKLKVDNWQLTIANATDGADWLVI